MPGALRFAPSLYAIGLFVSAFLLFAVQPMFTKMVLPLLGGAPTVWSSSHGVFPGRATLRLCLRPLHHPPIAIWRERTCTSGPTGYRSSDVADCRHPTPRLPPTDDVALWLIGILALSIGLPFAVLSTSAPLLQSWFAASGHSQARNPYALYAASNLGSFAGLLSYPIIVEPFLTLHTQAELWSTGFGMFALLVAAAAVVVARRENPSVASPANNVGVLASQIVLGCGRSDLAVSFVAVTSYIATDLALAPFLLGAAARDLFADFRRNFSRAPIIRHRDSRATGAFRQSLRFRSGCLALQGTTGSHWSF